MAGDAHGDAEASGSGGDTGSVSGSRSGGNLRASDGSSGTTTVEGRTASGGTASYRETAWRVQELIRLHDELDAHPELRDRSLPYLARQGLGLAVAVYLSAAVVWAARDSGVQGILIALLALAWIVVGGVQWAKHRRIAEVKRRIAELEDRGGGSVHDGTRGASPDEPSPQEVKR